MGRFGKGVMHLDWAINWALLMIFGLLSGVVLLGMSVGADSSDAGLMRGMGLLFVAAGLLGTYVTYLNLRKRRAT